MFNANNAREEVEKYNNEIEKARQQKAEQYCNTTVSEVIEKMAKMGRSSTVLKDLPADTFRIIRILSENGYKTTVGSNGLHIMW